MDTARLLVLSLFLLTRMPLDAEPASTIQVTHLPLRTGVLAVPSTVEIINGRFDIVLHLHGAPEVVEQNLATTRPKAVWANLTLPGLSSVYRRHFEDPSVLPTLLTEIEHVLATTLPDQKPQHRHLTVSSFSAGFGGVRELLKQPENRSRIDTLIMADSLYAGFVGEPADRTLNPEHLTPFLAFARLAASGHKRMLLSHTKLHTPDYASTKETADYLIHRMGAQRRQQHKAHPGGLIEQSRSSIGHFAVIGFEGNTGEAHMQHLQHIRIFLNEVDKLKLPE